MSTRIAHPSIPPAVDDALFNALREVIGTDLAFAAVDAAWKALSGTGCVWWRDERDMPGIDLLLNHQKWNPHCKPVLALDLDEREGLR